MSAGHLDIWVSDVGTPCGIAGEITNGTISVVDCDGIFNWSGGRFRNDGGTWQPVPASGDYLNLPFSKGHLEVELPPGCYGVIAAWVTPGSEFIHFNYATHMGLVTVCCDESNCVKLYNPSIRLCFNEFFHALRALAGQGKLEAGHVEKLQAEVGRLIEDAPQFPIENALIKAHAALHCGKQ